MEDIRGLLSNYESGNNERIFSDEVIATKLDFNSVPAFLLGSDLRRLSNQDEAAAVPSTALTRINIEKKAPDLSLPKGFRARILQPCLSTICLTTDSPSPVPVCNLVVKKGWKIFFLLPNGSPGPESTIDIRNPFASLFLYFANNFASPPRLEFLQSPLRPAHGL